MGAMQQKKPNILYSLLHNAFMFVTVSIQFSMWQNYH